MGVLEKKGVVCESGDEDMIERPVCTRISNKAKMNEMLNSDSPGKV